ncbi:hypothetical protein GM418_05185 [Maribellus comscasis]|uniref:Cytochrome b561 domain-containing protein n=1 Tax=Maribellus comscasis TaxID=2681766 RepID=A0A6I6JZE8_9BACT|nr:hypothetical protein [Maribellus comscasis]QGY43074.1 hypothetical protein GM418_05185 [Maribellus comscasis]
MNQNTPMEIATKIFVNSGLMILAIIFGIILHKTGKPFHSETFAIHKLATLGFMILTIMLMLHFSRNDERTGLLVTLISWATASVLVIILSGKILSEGKFESIMLKLHRTASAGLLTTVLISFYKILCL